jgi:hypothetical protein
MKLNDNLHPMMEQDGAGGGSDQQSPLRDKMTQMMNEKTGGNASQAAATGADSSQTPQQPEMTDEAKKSLEELIQTEWFKGLPQEQKDFITNGGNPDKYLDELDKAIVDQQIEAIREINRVRELEGKSEISQEDYKDKAFLEQRSQNEESGSDDDFLKLLREAEGQDDAEDDEDLQERAFKEIERKFAEAIDVDLDGATKEFDHSSSALRVEVKRNKPYEDTIKGILDGNDIKFKTSKKGNLKQALLKSYTQRHNHVTTPLVNSGLHITLSGAAIPEIIAIANIENPKSILELEFKKLSVIKKHLVDTSFGNVVNLQDLMKVIHYKDEQTLYFNLFVSTFPEENDYPMNCANEKCNTDLNLKVHSADLVLNGEEFKDQIDTILYKNMDIKDVIKQTKLSKIKQVVLKDYTAIGIRIPSLYDRLTTMSKIENWVTKSKKDTTNLNVVFGYLMFVEYVALPTPDGEYMKFDTIEDLIEILIGMEPESHNEIDEQIELYDNSKEVQYGIKAFVCPVCKRVHKQQRQKMDDLLFTLSRIRGMKNNLEKRKTSEKLKSLNEGK